MLLLRGSAADHRVIQDGFFDLLIALQQRGIYAMLRPAHTSLPGQRADRLRIVAGDDLDVHLILLEEPDALSGVFPQRIADDDRGDRFCLAQPVLKARKLPGQRRQQHPCAICPGRLDLFIKHKIRTDELRSAQHQRAQPLQLKRAPFARRRKGDPFAAGINGIPLEMIRHRQEGGVAI